MNEEMQTLTEHNSSHSCGAANLLVAAASTLLLLFIHLRNTSTAMTIDINRLRKIIVAEINVFANQAKASQCSPHLILAARYCLCAALDEAILLTPWGSQSGWTQQSLLSLIHRETWGGERFFIILEKMAADPQKNLSLLELLYFLLSLGFEGKYYKEDRMLREELQHRLYKLIIYYHPEVTQKLSPSLENLTINKCQKIKKLNHLKFWGGVLGIFFSIGIMFNIMLYWKAKPFLQDLKDISMEHSVFVITESPSKNKIILEKSPDSYSHAKHKHHRHVRNHISDDNIVLPSPVWGNS